MKITKLSTSKSPEKVCKEIEEMIPRVLGTNPNKTKDGKVVVYYPARRFGGTDDMMDDVRIVVRKVNNSLTSIKLENSERMKNQPTDPLIKEIFGDNWRLPFLERAHRVLDRCMRSMYPKEN